MRVAAATTALALGRATEAYAAVAAPARDAPVPAAAPASRLPRESVLDGEYIEHGRERGGSRRPAPPPGHVHAATVLRARREALAVMPREQGIEVYRLVARLGPGADPTFDALA